MKPLIDRRSTNLLRLVAAAAAASMLAATTMTAPALASGKPGLHLVSGEDWAVERVAGGYRVTLEVDAPLPVVDSAPVLYVDGEPVGTARESADGRMLSVVTADPSVASATEVTYDFGAGPAGPSAPETFETPTAVAPRLSPIDVDPAMPGAFSVGRADYDYGTQAVDLQQIGGINGEFRAAVYYPQGKTSAGRVVVLLHGRHSSCAGSPGNPARYPCSPSQVEIPSYLGYTYLAENLASHGYVVVSVSANAINANDNQLSDDFGAAARGHLVMSHLEFLAQVNAGHAEGAPAALQGLAGGLDLDNVGLMGHSRGGEGVVQAALINHAHGEPFGIKAVLPLAPVDYNRPSLPLVNAMTVLPYCDGDVEDLQGQHIIDDAVTTSSDEALRSAVLVMGANHNYFNTVWTPGLYPFSTSDDWSILDRQQVDPICGTSAPANLRLTDAEQRAVGLALMAGWFRLTLGGEEQFLPLFDGSGGTTTSMGDAQLTATASMPVQATKLVSTLGFGSTVTVTGTATATVCATAAGCGLPDAAAAQIPHWSQLRFAPNTPGTPVTNYTWAAPGSALTVPVPPAASDVERTEELTFRMTPDVTVGAVSDLAVTVTSKRGSPVTVRASDYSAAPTALPGSAPNLNKVLLRGVRIPVTDLVARGLDLNHVETIALSGLGNSGGTFLADLAFRSSAAGTTASSHTLPVLTIADRHVNEGSGPGTAEIAIHLDSNPRTDVSGHFELHNFDNGAASGEAHTPFTIPRGDTCVTVTAPLNGNTLPANAPTSRYIGTVSLVGGAITGDNNARLVVREDDAVIIDGEEQPLAPEPAPDPLCG